MTASNSVNIVIPGGSKGIITCTAHAHYYQKVNVHYFVNGRSRYTGDIAFYGQGEGLQMQADIGTKYINLPIKDTTPDADISLTISFLYNPKKPTSWADYLTAQILQPPFQNRNENIVIVSIGASDPGGDADNNDSICTIAVALPAGYNKDLQITMNG